MRRWFVLLAACGGGHAGPDAMIDAVVDSADLAPYEPILSVPAVPNPDLDVLFVVEDGPNMLAKQQHVGAMIGAYTASLAGLDVVYGVTSSDLGTSGFDSPTAAPALGACSGGGKGGAVATTTDPSALPAMLALGEAGCDFPQPFSAMAIATSFARAAANLAIVIVGDADDCSAADPSLFGPADATLGAQTNFRCFAQGVQCAPDQPSVDGLKNLCDARVGSPYVEDIAGYVGILNNLKADAAHQILLAAIDATGSVVVADGPVVSPACTFGAGETAQPAIRIQALAKAMGEHAMSSICSDAPDLSGLIAGTHSLVGDPCVHVMLSEPPDCLVDDVVGAAHATVPACGMQTLGPCWHFATDATLCPDAQHLELVVERPEPVAPGTVEELRCR